MDILLALGGGGSKGNAHIGVLRVLEREGFRVRAVAGTSAGGMAAAAYAAGHSPDVLEEYMSQVDQRSLFGFHFGDGPALMGIDGIRKALADLLGDITFKDLRIPCALTSVDLDTGQEMVLQEGRVLDAVLASVALPGIFPPKIWGDHTLVDGGVVDPVPVAVAREIAPKPRLPVVAVALSVSPSERSFTLGTDVPILNRMARLRVAQAFDIFLRSIEIGMSSIAQMRLQIDNPDVIIYPDVAHIGYLDRVNVPEVVRLGEQAAEAVLPALRQSTRMPGLLSRLFRS
jgi:NTE family protein